MKKTLFTLHLAFLFLISTSLAAQQTATISGAVTEVGKDAPIQFATVYLLKTLDSSVVKSQITDNAGHFKFQVQAPGKYLLKANNIGNRIFTSDTINVVSGANIDYNIKMEIDVKKIDEVSITAQRFKVVNEADKTVYVVNDKLTSAAATTLDVMRFMPGVQVDYMNNMTLEGNGNYLLFVDGKKRDKEYIEQIDPKAIDRIEISSTPSAKYDAEVSGIINIVLKKDFKRGISGRANSELSIIQGDYLKIANLGLNFEYSSQKYRIYASLRGNSNYFPSEIESQRQVGSSSLNSVGTNTEVFRRFKSSIGADFYITPSNTLTFFLQGDPYRLNSSTSNIVQNSFMDTTIMSTGNISTVGKNKDIRYSASTSFKHNFSKPEHELFIELNYENSENRNINDFTYYPSSIKEQLNLNIRNNSEIKTDYSIPVKPWLKLGLGGNAQWINYANSLESDGAKQDFKYTNNRQSAYITWSGKIKKFSWQTGVRAEMDYIGVNDSTGNHFINWLPQISFQQAIGKIHTLKLSYRKSVSRPGTGMFNPFVISSDSFTIQKGNPYLEPAISNRIEFSYIINFKGNSFTPIALYYNKFNRNFEQYTTTVGLITTTSSANFGEGIEYGAKMMFGIPGKKFQFGGSLAVYKQIIKANPIYNLQGNDGVGLRYNIGGMYNLPKKYSIIAFSNHWGQWISSQTTTKGGSLYGVGVQKEVLKTGRLSLLVINPFVSEFQPENSSRQGAGYTETSYMTLNTSKLFLLQFNYSFAKGKKGKPSNGNKREPESDDNSKGIFGM